MLVELLLSALLAQAAPDGPLGADWKNGTAADGEVVRFVRSDGVPDFIALAKQVCDCQPADATAQLKTILSKIDNAF
jgi:hypothetical protein